MAHGSSVLLNSGRSPWQLLDSPFPIDRKLPMLPWVGTLPLQSQRKQPTLTLNSSLLDLQPDPKPIIGLKEYDKV